MSEIASAYVSLLPSAKGFGSKMESQVGGEVKGSGKKLGLSFGRVFAAGAAVIGGTALIGGFLKDSLGEAREAQKVGAQTNAVLKSTGGVAGVTAIQVGRLATAISLKTGIDDEAIQSSENLLLTFTNLKNEAGRGNDVFNRATRIVTDMSVALGTDAKNSAIQVGKALNDPIKGITALSRVGVSFTAQQKEQIKTLVASGHTMQAQKLILGELKKEFGGSAAAAATSGDKFKVAFGNLKETVGTALLPLVDKIATGLTTKVIPAVSNFVTELQTGKGVGGEVAAVVGTLASNFGTIAPVLAVVAAGMVAYKVATAAAAVVTAIQTAGTVGATGAQWSLNAALTANPIGLVVVALTALAVGLVIAYKKSDTFRAIVNGAFTAIKTVAGPVLSWMKTAVGVTVDFVRNHWKLLVSIIGGPLVAIGILVVTHWSKIKSTVSGAVSAVIGSVKAMGHAIVARVEDVARFVIGVKQKFGEAVAFAQTIPGKIKAALSGAAGMLYSAGQDIIRGLISGIKSMAGAAASAAVGAVRGALDSARGALGIHSPSTKFAEVGMWSMLGLKKGIDDNAKHPLKAIEDALNKVRDKLKSSIDGIKSDMASLSSGIAQSFTGNLFEATTGAGLISSLTNTDDTVWRLGRAFKKLIREGLPASFLSALFQSGNSALILDLASGPKAQAQQAASLFGEVNNLSTQLGNQVAGNQYGAELRRQTHRLDQIENHLARLPKNIGHEINGAQTAGHRGRNAA